MSKMEKGYNYFTVTISRIDSHDGKCADEREVSVYGVVLVGRDFLFMVWEEVSVILKAEQ